MRGIYENLLFIAITVNLLHVLLISDDENISSTMFFYFRFMIDLSLF